MVVLLLASCLAGHNLPAQSQHQHPVAPADSIIVRPRLRVTALRPASAADSARGQALLAVARQSVAPYVSPDKARDDGYRVVGEKVKGQKVLHFVHPANARRNRDAFDPARPTALLYKPGPSGDLSLYGVMYTMPIAATLDQLDAAVPLSLATWHQHTNICRPPRLRRDDVAAFAEKKGFRHSTRTACEAAGGTFMEEGRSWMVHVNLMASNPAETWDHREHGGGAHMH